MLLKQTPDNQLSVLKHTVPFFLLAVNRRPLEKFCAMNEN